MERNVKKYSNRKFREHQIVIISKIYVEKTVLAH